MGEVEPMVERCPICDWPMTESVKEGCVPGNCSYRPKEGTAEYYRIQERRKKLGHGVASEPAPTSPVWDECVGSHDEAELAPACHASDYRVGEIGDANRKYEQRETSGDRSGGQATGEGENVSSVRAEERGQSIQAGCVDKGEDMSLLQARAAKWINTHWGKDYTLRQGYFIDDLAVMLAGYAGEPAVERPTEQRAEDWLKKYSQIYSPEDFDRGLYRRLFPREVCVVMAKFAESELSSIRQQVDYWKLAFKRLSAEDDENRQMLDDWEKQVEELKAALRTYGRHGIACATNMYHDCNCGFAEALKLGTEEGNRG